MKKNTEQVGVFVARLAALKQWRFQLGSEEITGEQMGDPACGLPLVLWSAQKIFHSAFGRDMGLRLEANNDAFFGVQVAEVGQGDAVSVVSLFCQDSLRQMVLHCHPELAQSENEQDPSAPPPVQVDDFVLEFIRDVSSGPLQITLPERVLNLVGRSAPDSPTAPAGSVMAA